MKFKELAEGERFTWGGDKEPWCTKKTNPDDTGLYAFDNKGTNFLDSCVPTCNMYIDPETEVVPEDTSRVVE